MAKTILIVEDNEFNLKVFTEILQWQGHTVISADTGTKGVDAAREHRPDLILMDIQLPDISGIEATKRIRGDDQLRTIPIIAVTAFAMPGDRESIMENGFDAYIPKPIVVPDFIRRIEEVLARTGKD